MTSENDYDLYGIEELSNDGRVLAADAVMFDELGRCVRVRISYRHGADAVFGDLDSNAINPEPLMWLLTHAHTELLTDCRELMSLQRDWLKDKDTMGRATHFVIKELES